MKTIYHYVSEKMKTACQLFHDRLYKYGLSSAALFRHSKVQHARCDLHCEVILINDLTIQ